MIYLILKRQKGQEKKGKINHNAEPDSFGIANAIKRLTQEYDKNNGKTRQE